MLEGLITKFITDKLVEELTQEFINKAGSEGIEEARRWFMKQPGVAKYLTNPLIKKIIVDSAPEKLKPILRGILSSEAIKDLNGLSNEDLQKKIDDRAWYKKLIDGAFEAIDLALDILSDSNTTNFLLPAMIGIGEVTSGGINKGLDNPAAVKSIGASSNGKFRKVSQVKFVKVSQKADDFLPNFSLNPNFKDEALQSYQKIVSSNASDREKSIMLNYLMSNLQSEVMPALEYIKEYLPDIYSYYESNYKW